MKFKLLLSLGLFIFLPFLGAVEKLNFKANDSSLSKPNIIVILMDDMGYGDISPFGSKLNNTPHLAQMAKEGMVLTNFYCAPVCSASRASLLTGCYPKRVSVGLYLPVSPVGLNPNEKTIASVLKPHGYSTMMVGKWHLGDQPEFLPTRFGFDHFFGLPYSNDMGGEQKTAPKDKYRPPLPLLQDNKVIEAPIDQTKITQRFTEESVKFIKNNKEGPFFLYLAHVAVHVPLEPGPNFKGKSKNGTYGDWVEESDWSVGRILETLRELKIDSKTLVIFTSDNGPWLSKGAASGVATPLRGGKFSTWEGGMREPAIAWWPGKIPAGTTSDVILSQIDILPTSLHLAGGAPSNDRIIDGKNIWPVLSGQSKNSPHEALYYFGGKKLEAVRMGPWKMAIAPQDKNKAKKELKEGDISEEGSVTQEKPHLYNLDSDIGETTNVADSHPEVLTKFRKLIAEMDKDLGVETNGPGVRPQGEVTNPQPLLLRSGPEYD